VRFLGPRREVGLQAQEGVGLPDQAVEAGFVQAKGLEELGPLLAVQEGDLALDLGRDHHGLGVVPGGAPCDRLGEGVARTGGGLVDIADVERGLGGQ